MFNMETFQNKEFGNIRIIIEDDKVLFCGTDVAAALGYKDTVNALKIHCKVDGVVFHHLIDSIGRKQNAKFISEGNLYRLIVQSRLPSAKRFERWVFDEVLPIIRKRGGYMTDKMLAEAMHDPSILFGFAEGLMKERRKNEALVSENNALKPKAEYYDLYIHPGDCTNIRITAKEMNIPEKCFIRFLLKRKFLYRMPSGTLVPYAIKRNKGLFEVKDYFRNGYLGSQTLITPKGKYILNLLYRYDEKGVTQ